MNIVSSEMPQSVSLGSRPPRTLNVVRNPRREEIDVPIDWSPWYLTEEQDVGEGGEQEQIISMLKSILHELARERTWGRVHIAGDQFFAWLPSEPLVRVSPDVYLVDDPPPPPFPAMWKTWLADQEPPRFAVEVVSGDEDHPARWRKDYEESPAKYSQLGTRELVIFDPDAAAGRAGKGADERVALQVYRREADNSFVRAYVGAGPARSHELDAWLVVAMEGPAARLRLSRDAQGTDLVPTVEEAREEAEQKLAEALAEIERLRRGE